MKKNENFSILVEAKNVNNKKNARITAQKILQKYKRMKISKKTYLVNEEDIETIDYNDPEEDLFEGESIVKAANKVLDYEGFKRNQEKLLKNSSKKSNKSAQITAEKILQKYKILKKPKKTFLVDEKDLETIVYDPEEQEDLFTGERILAAANKVLDFEEFKKQQAKAIGNYNQDLLKNAETMNYIDDINLNDVKDNKDLKIISKKVIKKYRKLRKRKAASQEKKVKEIIDRFNLLTKKRKRQVDKAAPLASKNISKKYKNIRFH